MQRIKRSLFVLLALILLPLAAARAQQTDDILWRGTVTVNYLYSADWQSATGSPSLHGSHYEHYVNEITAVGTGLARQNITYFYRYEQEVSCPTQNPPYFYIDKYMASADETVTRPYMTFSVGVNDTVAWIDILQAGITVTDHHVPACGGGPTEGERLFSYTAAPFFHNGEYSSDSTEIFGRVDGGSFEYPNYGINPGWESGIITTIYNLTGAEEDTPWISPEDKRIYWESSEILSRTAMTQVLSAIYQGSRGRMDRAGGHAAVSISASVAALIDGYISFDPPDPNFTEISVPVTPTTSQQPILPGEDVTQAQADAFNALLTNLQQGIGLGRAILTSFNRASGAQVANDSYWMGQQLQAARIYSDQYADVLDARPQILEDMKRSFQSDPEDSFVITGQDIMQYRYDLVTNGLSPEQEQLLTELGVDARGRAQVLHAMILAELPQETSLQDPVAQFPELLTDPELIQSTHELAFALREFAAAEGWKIYAPLVGR